MPERVEQTYLVGPVTSLLFTINISNSNEKAWKIEESDSSEKPYGKIISDSLKEKRLPTQADLAGHMTMMEG